MNRLLLWMLLCGTFYLVSCNKDDENRKDTIELETYSVELWAGQDTIVEILSNKDHIYKVFSPDEKIAKAVITGDVVKIKTHQHGITAIVIMDETIQNQVDIDILSRTFTGGWRITHNESLPQGVVVQIDDLNFEAMIKEEVTLYGLGRVGNVMEFISSSNSFQLIDNDNKIVSQGTYEFENLTLVLSGSNENVVCDIIPYSLKLVLVDYDMTDYFKKRYPQLEIKKVSLQQYWNYITF